MKLIYPLMAGAFFALGLPVAPAGAASCGPLEQVAAQLAGRFDERPLGDALTNRGMLQLWANEATGTFTITVTAPNGLACIIAYGTSWESAPVPPAGDPA